MPKSTSEIDDLVYSTITQINAVGPAFEDELAMITELPLEVVRDSLARLYRINKIRPGGEKGED